MLHYFKGLLIFMTFISWEANSQVTDTLVNVGNHRLAFKIIKGNNPPILFESGNGDSGSIWENIVQPIHDSTGATLITYDRAGLGRSEIDTSNISFKQEINDLNMALISLGFDDHIFLVAHSFGGIYASEFARRISDRIIGGVFIDVSTPCQLTTEYANRVYTSISDENWSMIKQYKPGLFHVLDKFPDIAAIMTNRNFPDSIPLTVITAEHYKPNPHIGETEEVILLWKECLKNLGELPFHKYVTTKNTDHKVWEKDPKTVIDEISQLYNQIISGSHPSEK